jgi:hypothetical protein
MTRNACDDRKGTGRSSQDLSIGLDLAAAHGSNMTLRRNQSCYFLTESILNRLDSAG